MLKAMIPILEKYKRKRRVNALTKFIVKTKNHSQTGLITLNDFVSINKYYKENLVATYDDYNSTLLTNLLKEVYGNSVDASLSKILDELIAAVTKIAMGINDNRYNGYDQYIIQIIRMLGKLGTPKAEEKILTLIIGKYEIKVWRIIDDGLCNAIENLYSERAIDSFILFIKTRRPLILYLENAIINRLRYLETQAVNPLTKEKLKAINHEISIRQEKKERARIQQVKEQMEQQRVAEYKQREAESQKWWDDHPDQERDPSRMDR